MSNYATEIGSTKGNPNDPTFLADQSDIPSEIGLAKGYATAIVNAASSNTMLQTDIAKQTTNIETAATNLANNPSESTSIQQAINGDSTTLTGDLNSITSNMTTEVTNTGYLVTATARSSPISTIW